MQKNLEAEDKKRRNERGMRKLGAQSKRKEEKSSSWGQRMIQKKRKIKWERENYTFGQDDGQTVTYRKALLLKTKCKMNTLIQKLLSSSCMYNIYVYINKHICISYHPTISKLSQVI